MKTRNQPASRIGSSKCVALSFCILFIAYFCSLPLLFAVSPPPDGGYPNQNTAEGEDALLSLGLTAINNTAVGYHALYSNRDPSGNTAVGSTALAANTGGIADTAVGDGALARNISGGRNTATGSNALGYNTTGEDNTAFGAFSLFTNTTGNLNTAVGYQAMYYGAGGGGNVAIGSFSLYDSDSCFRNTAVGSEALESNTTASDNTALGAAALSSNSIGAKNTAVGSQVLTNSKGSNNIAIGFKAGASVITGSDNIMIGNQGGSSFESGTIRIGSDGKQRKTYIAGISGATVAGGVGVIIDDQGHLGTITSSARYKEAIKPMNKSSEAILSLTPVNFRYKKELDPQGIPQFGLVAEDVAKVDPDLVARDEEGKPYTVRYEAVNAMLLNEFLKEHKKVEEQARLNVQQQATIAEQQKQIDTLAKSLKEQTARLQQVSDQVTASRRDLRLVGN